MNDPTTKGLPASRILGVFVDGEERKGVGFYAYWKGVPSVEPLFPEYLWPSRLTIERHVLRGENWTVLWWDAAMTAWPGAGEWESLLRCTFQVFLNAGASVAWCGLDGFFAEPPALFDPSRMSGSVYAAAGEGWPFTCLARLDAPLKALSDEQLLELRSLL